MNSKSYIAAFDIDGTIIRFNSSKVVIKAAHKKGLMSSSALIYAIYLVFLYKYNLKDTLKIIHKMGSWMSGIKIEKFKELVEESHNSSLINAIRPEIIKEIEFHKNNNAELVILSSAVSDICNHIARHLGIDHILCTELETHNGIYTGRPIGKFCFAEEKLHRLKEYCSTHDFLLKDIWYYADSIDDIHVLNQVGHPVCVTPDKKLMKIASAKGWTINLWK